VWNFNEFKDNIAVFQENGEGFTYSQLQLASEELASNIKKRCLVFNLCSNEIGSLIGYVGFINARIVPFMAEASLDLSFLNSLRVTYKPEYLWCPKNVAHQFADCIPVFEAWNYILLQTSVSQPFHIFEDLALLLTTSGSTGSPKLVRQSYANLKANTNSIIQYLKIDSRERAITTLPMSYTYGLSIINTHLFAGASLVITNHSLMQREFWQIFKRFEATSFGGVPYTYEMLEKIRFERMDLPSLRTMTQAGGKLMPELHKKFAKYAIEKKIDFVVMYGQTEATARMSYLPPEKALEKYGSMGIAIPGGAFSLIDENGSVIIEADVIGELVYRGPNVTLGYAQCGEDLALGDEWSGILVTGDMAKRDKDGYYYVVGRKKRFLKIYGSRVNLDECEGMLRVSFPETECACSGIDDAMQVFIIDGSIKLEIRKVLAEKTGLNQMAFHVQVIDRIPRNDSGKILYSELPKSY